VATAEQQQQERRQVHADKICASDYGINIRQALDTSKTRQLNGGQSALAVPSTSPCALLLQVFIMCTSRQATSSYICHQIRTTASHHRRCRRNLRLAHLIRLEKGDSPTSMIVAFCEGRCRPTW
jgi:hypothetical protein